MHSGEERWSAYKTGSVNLSQNGQHSKDLLELASTDEWSGDDVERLADEPQLHIDVDGFEGPLDLLLELSKRQKVDLAKISILALAEQYLEFIEEARKLRIELAADYLVMAAWLAYLKSKLLIPADPGDEDELSGEEMAALLAFRLKRLEAMREAGKRLINRNRLGKDFFARGMPEPIIIDRQIHHRRSSPQAHSIAQLAGLPHCFLRPASDRWPAVRASPGSVLERRILKRISTVSFRRLLIESGRWIHAANSSIT